MSLLDILTNVFVKIVTITITVSPPSIHAFLICIYVIFYIVMIAATFVHTYFMQPYTIPTSSLEKSLLVGDFLFVSKFHYGARVPMTTIAAPMVHDTIPIIKRKSYLNKDKF